MRVLTALCLLLVVLRLTWLTTLSWWFVFMPLWAFGLGLGFVCLWFGAMLAFFVASFWS